ncbi:MAG TPA: hypothetical protein V6C57_19920 [Coleofasciculaceae cyanobacterium]
MSEANMYVFDSATRKFVPWDGTVAGGGGGGGTTGGATEITLAEVLDRLPEPEVRDGDFLIATGPGTLAAGTISYAVANTGTTAGLLQGKSYPAGLNLNWSTQWPETFSEVSYDGTGTTLVISWVR